MITVTKLHQVADLMCREIAYEMGREYDIRMGEVEDRIKGFMYLNLKSLITASTVMKASKHPSKGFVSCEEIQSIMTMTLPEGHIGETIAGINTGEHWGHYLFTCGDLEVNYITNDGGDYQ